ncbi:MAG: LPXTG cell wall anchor domain-containing protein, partial [Eggerthellaceae bacterium]|nr:LPXTG cell wall anchor domain-containing protein [Eggerthellaceae bacterium]
GVLPGDGGAGDSGTIRRARLAQTGDALAALAGAALAAALAAGAALLAARRRSRA